MGERAFTDEATSEDLAAMKRELRIAIKAGAAGFSTSRNKAHQTARQPPGGEPSREVGRGAWSGRRDG